MHNRKSVALRGLKQVYPHALQNKGVGVFCVQPILLLSLSIVIGVAAAVTGVYSLVLLIIPLGTFSVWKRRGVMLIVVMALCVGLGVARVQLLPQVRVEEGVLQATVTALHTPLRLESGYYRGRVRTAENIILQMYAQEPWESRHVLVVSGEVKHPTPPLNPGELDYSAHLERQGVAGMFFVSELRPVARLRASVLDSVRTYMAGNLALLRTEAYGLALAIALGDKSGLTLEEKEHWRNAGVSHLLAVSGLHVGILSGAVYLCLRKITGFRGSLVLAAFSAIAYALVVGGSMSAWRAALSFALGAAAKMALRDTQPINIAALVAALMLLVSPQTATDPGFLLSFSATVGLMLLAPTIAELIPGPRGLRMLVAASAAAQLATVPLVLESFSAWPVYGLPVNLVLVPASSVIVAGAFLVALFGSIPFLGTLLCFLFTCITFMVSAFVRGAAALPHAAVNLMALPLLLAILYYCILLLMPVAARRMGRYGTAVCLMMLLMFMLLPTVLYPAGTEITFLGVGNADAAHLRVNGNHYLIDSGTADAGGRVVVPYLRSQGVNSINAVFISHTHEDHVGGLAAISEAFTVKNAFIGPDHSSTTGESRVLSPNLKLKVGETELMAWQASGQELDLNHRSIVLSLQQGAFRALFTGDIGAAAELELLPDLDHIHVLKVAHHGSRTSTTPDFVNAARPQVAVVPTGPNRHGHPDQVVLDRLSSVGALVLRTDEGAVRIRVNSKYYHVYIFTKGEWRRVRTYALPGLMQRSFEDIVTYLCSLRHGGMVYCQSNQRYIRSCA